MRIPLLTRKIPLFSDHLLLDSEYSYHGIMGKDHMFKTPCFFLFIAINFGILSTVGYSRDNLVFDKGIQYNNVGYQIDIQQKLIENKIPFQLDAEGILRYSQNYQKEIDMILSFLDSRPSMHFKNRKYAVLFSLLLQEKNIFFLIRDGATNDIHIIWNQADKEEVDKIYNDFQKAVIESEKSGVFTSIN